MRIFSSYFKERWVILLIYVVALFLLMWMYIGLFPSIKSQAQSFNQLIQQMPEGLRSAFGADAFDYSNLGSYLSTEMFGFLWPLVMIIFTLSWAANALAGEVELGTVEIVLSKPVSRLRVYWERYLAGVAALFIYVVFSILSLIPFARLYSIDISHLHPVLLSLLCFLFGMAVFSLGTLLSAIFSDKSKVYAFGAGLLVLTYVLNIVASLKDSLSDLKYGSFFYYFNPAQAIVHDKIVTEGYWVFILFSLVTVLLGAWYWNRRDITA
ncbi:ABC transporter permease subunit [Patescibacteria group bacterium]|nr:ABC transporter permease subunit [Patescibacteria group bacterium]